MTKPQASFVPRFQAAPLPSNEAKRLKALLEYSTISSTSLEEALNDLTALAAQICGTPVALVSLVEGHRQWFKSKVGLEATETSRESSFCAHAILNPDEIMVIPNALNDDRFADNPLVTDDPNIRFYAGSPLVTRDGYALGTLCAIDRIPRSLSREQLEALRIIGRQVLTQMELRLDLARLERQNRRQKEAEAKLRASDAQVVDLLETMTDAFFALDRQWRFTYVNQKAAQLLQRESSELLGQELWQVFPELVGSNFDRQLRQAVSQQVGVIFEKMMVNGWSEIRVFPSYEGLSVFFHDITQRKQMETMFAQEQEKSERLLLNVLPKAIAERLKQSETTIADSFTEATVLFADLVGFTELSGRTSPTELVEILNTIFSEFDQLAERHDLEKIKTVGDAYMVVGGVPMPRSDHAEAIANMALDIQASITQFCLQTGEPLSIRIGIHTGPVVAGVIGIKKFTYDLWGDTVNIASRMESHGIAGEIQISETTYQKLQGKYVFQERGLIPIKGKGEMRTYLLRIKN